MGLEATFDVDIAELKAALDVDGTQGWEELRELHGGLVKPKIVFFGEDLPERFGMLHTTDLETCELLIVMGTSLVVAPFNSLVELASPMAPRLLVNREVAGLCEELPGGFRFHLQGEGQ